MSEPLGLFDGVLARGGVREAVGDRAWLQALLDVEAALARAAARCGIVEAGAAEAVAAACRAERFDLPALAAAAADGGNPVIPLVRALREAVGPQAAEAVHPGATSQDVLDTAAMLVARRALAVLLDDLDGAVAAAAALAAAHRTTPAVGRTLLQHALPITFGLKAAGWLVALDEAADGLRRVRDGRLAVQLGGAVGTLASFGDRGPAVVAGLADELGLREPVLPWHTARGRIGELAGTLGVAAAAAGKVARDLTLLAATDVAEVAAGQGGSSTLPHKRNPVAAVAAAAGTEAAPGLVATLLAAGSHQEHERAAGAWHAEWRPLTELLRTTGSAAAWLREALAGLEVDEDRLRANLDRSGGVLLAERVAGTLAPALGRTAAHDRVAAAAREAASSGRPFADVLLADATVAAHLDARGLSALLDATTYLGAATAFVDRALAAHGARAVPSQEEPP